MMGRFANDVCRLLLTFLIIFSSLLYLVLYRQVTPMDDTVWADREEIDPVILNARIKQAPYVVEPEEDLVGELSPEDVAFYMEEKVNYIRWKNEVQFTSIKELLDESEASIAFHRYKEMYQRNEAIGPSTFNLTLWTLSFSEAEYFDIQNVLRRFGVRIIKRSYSSLCKQVGSCASFFVDKMDLIKMPYSVKNALLREMKTSQDWQNIDAFLCFAPASVCESFAYLGKPFIYLPVHRYELGRSQSYRWRQLNSHLHDFVQNGPSVLASRCAYDRAYMQHFEGDDVSLLLHHGGYVNMSYSPAYNKVLLYPGVKEVLAKRFISELTQASNKLGLDTLVEELQPDFNPFDLVKYKAIILIPFMVTSIRLTELYRMNIPLYIPSRELLYEWEKNYKIIIDRILPNSTAEHTGQSSNVRGIRQMPDPNVFENRSVQYWINKLDYYEVWPFIEYFSDAEDLVSKIKHTTPEDFQRRATNMARHNQVVMSVTEVTWKNIINKVAAHIKPNTTIS